MRDETSIASIFIILIVLLLYAGRTAEAASGPAFVYPVNGQSLDYYGCWLFKVEPMAGVTGDKYLWGFFQNGSMVWENYANEGHLSGTEYGICPDSTAYSRFQPGLTEVWVRAQLPGGWTDPSVIQITLSLPKVPLSITKTGDGIGTVTSSPAGISCGSTCTADFSGGTTVTLTADPFYGSTFGGWSGACAGTEKTCSVTLDESTTVTAQFVDAETARRQMEIPVLVLAYFPDEDKDGLLDTIAGDAKGRSVSQTKVAVTQLTEDLVATLEKGSRYHGYKDDTSVASLRYRVIDTKYFDNPIPVSTEFTPFADHLQVLNEQNICNYVENNGVKEVWIWMYHSDAVAPIESNMAGPYGDISNSYRQADLPVCDSTYTVYDYNYGRGLSEATEDHMHQLESVFKHVDYELFWGTYVGPVGSAPGQRRCGNAHYPPNGTSDYDWGNHSLAVSDCEDWHPDMIGQTQTFNCDKWDCDSVKYFIWWMQNIPGAGNSLFYNGNKLRNWWQFIGDFDAAMGQGRSFVDSIPGDFDADGQISIAEVQSAINMYLGLKTTESCVDTDAGGSVSIAEVQKVINGYLGL